MPEVITSNITNVKVDGVRPGLYVLYNTAPSGRYHKAGEIIKIAAKLNKDVIVQGEGLRLKIKVGNDTIYAPASLITPPSFPNGIIFDYEIMPGHNGTIEGLGFDFNGSSMAQDSVGNMLVPGRGFPRPAGIKQIDTIPPES